MKEIYILITLTIWTFQVYGQGTQVGDSNSPIYHYNENVGINKTDPVAPVEISSSNNEFIRISYPNGYAGYLRGYKNGYKHWYVGAGSAGHDGLHLMNYKDYHLYLGTNSTTRLTILNTGKIGIGTTLPNSMLEIYDSNVYTDAYNSNSLIIRAPHAPSPNDNRMVGLTLTFDHSDRLHSISQKSVGIYAQSTSNWGNRVDMLFYTRDYNSPIYDERMRIKGNGNVGIGTTSPDYKLDVLGTIRANEVKVATGWSDFVFEPDYDLKSLDQVEEFITKNGHLPDIPSAEEVEKNGISLGEMDSKLLQKIEELTLYVIELKKENMELKKQTSRIDQLEELLNEIIQTKN